VEPLNAYRDAQKPEGNKGGSVWTRKSNGVGKPAVSDYDPDIKKSGATRMTFSNAKFPDLSNKPIWLEKIDTAVISGVFIKHTDGSIEQVAFGEAWHGGHGRETDIVHVDAERGYEPSKLKLPGFVTLGIKMATSVVSIARNEIFAKVMIAPGCSEPVLPLPHLVDEDGVVDSITECHNADKTIRQRRACFLRIENVAGELVRFVVVIEAQKLAMPPIVKTVRYVELREIIEVL
jgi:hypothetical protein